MTCRIFISYRRDSDLHSTERLFDRLITDFGRDNLFMDIAEGSIKPGDNFAERLREKIGSCEVLLAVIGRGWLDAKDHRGNRRLDSPSDFVRVEIVSALEQGKRVIPVLVDNTFIPHSDLLPDPLKKLIEGQAVRLTNENFRLDCDRFMRQLHEFVIKGDEDRDEDEAPGGRLRRTGASAIGAFRGSFWAHLVARHPSEVAYGEANRASSRWRTVDKTDLVVVKYLSKRGVGVFIRGKRGADPVEVADQLTPLESQIGHRLGAEFNNEQYMFHKWMPCDGEDRSNWDRMADWLKAEADRYDTTLKAALN